MEDAILTAELFIKAKKIAHVNLTAHCYRVIPTSAMRNKSKAHYKKVIYDNFNAAMIFDNLFAKIPTEHPKAIACKKRLKTRQQSFVFFALVRFMKSDILTEQILFFIDKVKKIKAYPLNNFISTDYNGINYSILVFIFNREKLLIPFVKLFRLFYNFKQVILNK